LRSRLLIEFQRAPQNIANPRIVIAKAQRTAERHGDDGAVARPLKSSFQRSAISFQLSPDL
jgi:hypothetical protein